MDYSNFKRIFNLNNKYVVALIVILILAIGVIERTSMLKFQGLYEPDGFYYYSIIMQTIAHHYIRPGVSVYSGFPWHNIVAESPGLEYITVIPYMFLHYFGISALSIMRIMPVVFALFEIIAAYYLTRFIVNSKLAGLLAMFFLAVSSGNGARTSALVYRGDSFISLFIMLAMIFMLLALRNRDLLIRDKNTLRRNMLRAHIGEELVRKHIKEEKELESRQKTELAIIKTHDRSEIEKFIGMHKAEMEKLFGEHIKEEEMLYASMGGTESKQQEVWVAKPFIYTIISAFILSLGVVIWTGSPYIVVVYMLSILFILIYGFIAGNKGLLLSDILLNGGLLFAYALERLFILIHFAPAGITLTGTKFFVFYIPLLLANIAAWYILDRDFRIAKDPISRFSLLGIVSIIAIALSLTLFIQYINAMTSTVGINILPLPKSVTNTINYAVGQTTQELQRPSWAFLFGSFHVQLILAPLGIILFLFLGHRIGKTMKHKAGLSINFNEGMLAMLAYFIVTAFLQYAAIRYNSLFSIPIAIFAAYGTYAIWALLKDIKLTQKVLIAFMAVAFDLIIIYEIIKKVYPLLTTNIILIVISAIIINGLLAYVFIYGIYATRKSRMDLQNVFVGLMVALLVLNFYSTYVQSLEVGQADGINAYFLQAMAWMRNNTPSNATVLTMWPDGSVVEALAQRQSYTDSVGGENASRIYPFASFLFNTSQASLSYIEKVHPEYIVARTFWFNELPGIAAEGLVNNVKQYGYNMFQSYSATHNNTTEAYIFNSTNYKAEMLIVRANNTTKLFAYMGNSSSQFMEPISDVLFYNATSYNYSMVKTNSLEALNETLMVMYSSKGITGALLFGPELFESNIFKLVYLCNYYTCPYNGSIRMRAVYMNNDTRIIRVYYNNT
ncbi:MAG: STT3 domain-containing protein [Candidatus Micrarchaeia archaeon]